MKTKLILALAVLAATATALGLAQFATAEAASKPVAAGHAEDTPTVERGRYLARIGGCNDCHTAGYAQTGGEVPEAQWLLGDSIGWEGPWGTTYPPNLRLSLQRWSEDEWVQVAKNTKFRPPMPWFALRDMKESDLRSFYRYVRELGPAGEPAPAYLPPGVTAPGPVVVFPSPPPQD